MKTIVLLVLALALSAQSAAAQSTGTPPPPTFDDHIDTVDVTAPKVPLDQAIHNFVKSYSHPTEVAGKIARWSAGMPLCPNAMGLQSTFNVFVAERIRTITGMVRAPLDSKVPCTPNLEVIFTPHPQDVLDNIAKDNEDLLGYHDVAQTKQLATMSHPIQAWYETATRDNNGLLQPDRPNPTLECTEAWAEVAAKMPGSMQKVMNFCSLAVTGNHLNDGLRSEIGEVTVIVDSDKIVGMPLGAVSDYIAMLALSQTNAFETCQPLPSITNLMTAGCEAQKSQTLTETDIAYLKAIYKASPDAIGSIQTSEIAHQMEAALGGH